jgi:hypothetical protein
MMSATSGISESDVRGAGLWRLGLGKCVKLELGTEALGMGLLSGRGWGLAGVALLRGRVSGMVTEEANLCMEYPLPCQPGSGGGGIWYIALASQLC